MLYLLCLSGRPSVFCADLLKRMNNLGVAKQITVPLLQWYSRDLVSSSNGLFDVVKLGRGDDNKFVFLRFVNEHVNHCERIV